jgi:hypothetical protein
MVCGHIVNTIWKRLAQMRIGEIMRPDCFRGALRLPFLALVGTIADQFLFLRIMETTGAALLARPDLRVNVFELRVTVWVRVPSQVFRFCRL